MQHLYGSVEAGGTKFICAVGTGPDDLRNIESFPTTTPEETMGKVLAYFKTISKTTPLTAVGISSFGPIDLDTSSETYGYITTTPKPSWHNTNVVGVLKNKLNIPVFFDTDVNGAALAEGAWGAAKNLDTFIYITVGTGVGLGVIANGKPLHGLVHPEGGHMLLPAHPDDSIQGVCPFHIGCLEGLVCGPAVEKRCDMKGADIPDTHGVWNFVTHYIALGLANFICTISPQKIILGGGIMKRDHLFPKIRENVVSMLGGYISSETIKKHIDTYIVPPHLAHCGVLGGIQMAMSGSAG